MNTVRDIAKYDSGSDMTTVVNHLIYDAFGRVTWESNATIDSLFLFTGRPFDSDTQLQNNLNRWYDAHVGRWLSEDPIGFAGGDGDLCRYVGNRVVDLIDSDGNRYVPPSYTLRLFYKCSAFMDLFQGDWKSCDNSFVAMDGDLTQCANKYYQPQRVIAFVHPREVAGQMLSCVMSHARADLTEDQLRDFSKGFQCCIKAVTSVITHFSLRQVSSEFKEWRNTR